jgi:hypothetical protein
MLTVEQFKADIVALIDAAAGEPEKRFLQAPPAEGRT